jgi:prepilin-type N-terminal cleavage/methylation domain-containing protein
MCKEKIRSLNSSRGMTLVELIVVMAILSVVMMAVMSLFIPMHQSTAAQTQVSDVQSNLRLALNTMTRDLLTAGFLASRNPIVFPDAVPDFTSETLTSIGDTTNTSDFIIRTRAVGDGFGRIISEPSPATAPSYLGNMFTVSVADSAMDPNFSNGSKVRIFGSMNGDELIASINGTVSSANRVVTVSNVDTTNSTIDFDVSAASLTAAEKDELAVQLVEAVLVRVRDDSQPSLQTIRYRLNNGALERIINGSTQILARNVSAVTFNHNWTPQNRVNRVDIKLTGETKALKNDAISGVKTREVETSVRLRNIF